MVDTLRDWLTSTDLPSLKGIVDSAGDDASVTLGELHDLRATERFVDRGEIGRGGSGSVRRVYDACLMRDIAMKVLLPRAERNEPALARFVEEAQITGQLQHPFIVPVYEAGRDGHGTRYFTMKLVDGRTLEELIAEAGPDRLSPDRIADLLDVFIKVCDAIEFAHSRRVVHRDLKPENVMVGSFGQVYLMDWGGATLVSKTRSKAPGPPPIEVSHNQVPALSNRESFIGSAAYMAPEQAHRKNEDLDERTDIFQLGGILYEILTGRAPYSHCATFFEAILYASQREIASPEEAAGRPVPAELARIAMKAMAADPAERYPSAAALRKDVECFQRGAWHVPQQTFEAGARIVVEGEPGDTAYVIVEGRCLAYKGSGASRIPLREMGPGEVFGETAVLSEKPRTATVEALDPLTLLVVSRATLTEGLGLNSWLGVFVRALAERFRELDARLHSFEGHAP